MIPFNIAWEPFFLNCRSLGLERSKGGCDLCGHSLMFQGLASWMQTAALVCLYLSQGPVHPWQQGQAKDFVFLFFFLVWSEIGLARSFPVLFACLGGSWWRECLLSVTIWEAGRMLINVTCSSPHVLTAGPSLWPLCGAEAWPLSSCLLHSVVGVWWR